MAEHNEAHHDEHKDDFKPIMFGVIGLFLLVVVLWVSILFLNSCGPHLECQRADTLNLVVRTPIPTLVPGTLPAQVMDGQPGAFNKCAVKALDLFGAWVSAGSPESEAFAFEDVNANPCEATFGADVQPLLSQSQVWYPASLSCKTRVRRSMEYAAAMIPPARQEYHTAVPSTSEKRASPLL